MRSRDERAPVATEPRRPSDFAVDLARLSGAVAEGADPARVARLEATEAHFRAAVFPRTVDAVVAALQPEPRRWWLPSWRPVFAAAGLATAVVVAVLVSGGPAGVDEPGLRFKGAVGLEVFGHRADATFRVGDGAELRRGDRLKFRVLAPDQGWIAVFSVEDGGRVTPFHPAGSGEPMRVGPAPWLTPDSIELDDSVGPERVIVVFRREPFDVASLARELQATARRAGGVRGPLGVPPGFEHASLLFVKVPEQP